MKTVIKTLIGAALLVAATACGGQGGGDASAELKTPLADVQAEATKLDAPALESKIESYKAMAKDYEGQIEELQNKAKEALADTDLGDLLSEDAKKAKELADKYTGQADEIMKDLKALQERMNIYVQELKKKAG